MVVTLGDLSMHSSSKKKKLTRRELLVGTAAAGSAVASTSLSSLVYAAPTAPALSAGEGVVEITPPVGIELAGFHRKPGSGRRVAATRQPTAVRALVLKRQKVMVVIVAVDILAVSAQFAERVARRIAKKVGLPAAHVRICATHSHSTPTLRYLRQWGGISKDYEKKVEAAIVRAAELGHEDLASAALYLGKSRSVGANFNRTSKTWKTDKQFTKDSSDAERWLDTTVHVLRCERGRGKRELFWYHFSAHPVCYADGSSGPDWPGGVLKHFRQDRNLQPAFLQGHAGDVNPGDGTPWLGDPEETVSALVKAMKQAEQESQRLAIEEIRLETRQTDLPLNLEIFKQQLAQYREHPEKCQSGPWVDAGFAADWAKGASRWDLKQPTLKVAMSAVRLGPLGIVFHPAELFSYYGLAIRRDSPFEDTLVVGYTDGLIGYLTDPLAYKQGAYSAQVVPKILDLPPFTPDAAARMSQKAVALLKEI